MRCRKVRSFLSAFCREETSPALSAKIKEHLSDCGSCRREEAAYKSMKQLIVGLPRHSVADDFTARLFQKIGQAGFAEKKTKAYFPKRIPRMGMSRLAAVASVAVIILAMGIGLHLGDHFFTPNGSQVIGPTATRTANSGDDRYLTVQPVDNPLLNEHKSVSKMVAQYSRWRQFSERLRENAGVRDMLGAQNAAFASSQGLGANSPIIVRPVVRDYLIVPE